MASAEGVVRMETEGVVRIETDLTDYADLTDSFVRFASIPASGKCNG
jgi:hypothetical protein